MNNRMNSWEPGPALPDEIITLFSFWAGILWPREERRLGLDLLLAHACMDRHGHGHVRTLLTLTEVAEPLSSMNILWMFFRICFAGRRIPCGAGSNSPFELGFWLLLINSFALYSPPCWVGGWGEVALEAR